nr:MAG: Putative binding domain, N-terminal [Bacteriophage sp.]
MSDFEISSLSGTGPATIRVKPKAANESESNKEQVIKVIVQGVEREVTFTQKGNPK